MTSSKYPYTPRRHFMRTFWWPCPLLGGLGLFLMIFGQPTASIPAFGAGLVAAVVVLLIAEGFGL